jgi:hypothetical protein
VNITFRGIEVVKSGAVVERVSKVLGVPPEELIVKGVEEFLQAQLRMCLTEIQEVKTRYGVKDVVELKRKIREGVVEEHPAWEDLILLENLEERARTLREELRALKT